MAHNGVISLLPPQLHSVQAFLSHLNQSNSFVRHFLLRSFAHPTTIAIAHITWCLRLVLRPEINRVPIIALGVFTGKNPQATTLRNAVSRQNSMPIVLSDQRHVDTHYTRCSLLTIPHLPQFADEPRAGAWMESTLIR